MNWKKFLTFLIAAPIASGLGTYVQNPGQPFTFRTVGIPAILTLASTLTALFTQAPHTDETAQASK